MATIRPASLIHYVDLVLDAICVVDPFGRFVFASAAFERIFGYAPQTMIGRPMIDLVHPEDRSRTLEAAEEIMRGQHKVNFENRWVHKDGTIVHVLWSARWSETDQVRVAVARDITQRKRAEIRQTALYAVSEAAHSCEDLATLYAQIHEILRGVMPTRAMTVALHDEVSGRLVFPYRYADHGTPEKGYCSQVIGSGRPVVTRHTLGVAIRSHHGITGAVLVQNAPGDPDYSGDDCEFLEYVATQVAAAVERHQMLKHLQRLALHDPLTQLPNRLLFDDRIHVALAKARRKQRQLALLYLDLDRFKQVNDTFGHSAGDVLLQHTAQRILGCVRESDTVARFGGDEFVILLENMESSAGARLVAHKVREALSQPYQLDGHVVYTPPSIGIAMFPADGDNEKLLLRRADEAMYLEKKRSSEGLSTGTGP